MATEEPWCRSCAQCLGTFNAYVCALAVSPDGRMLYTADHDISHAADAWAVDSRQVCLPSIVLRYTMSGFER